LLKAFHQACWFSALEVLTLEAAEMFPMWDIHHGGMDETLFAADLR
jgi:hypothetical protein